jgi:excisionase family DNA binding protein
MDESPSQELSFPARRMNYDQAAEYLGISRQTLQNLARTRRITVCKTSPRHHYFLPEDLNAYIKKNTQKAIK